MKTALMWIWQAPQNLIGLFLRFRFRKSLRKFDRGLYYSSKFPGGGISLGSTIVVRTGVSVTLIRHELGHRRQSEILGPLYLLVIGIPSIAWAGVVQIFGLRERYYRFYTEAWADKIAGIKRVRKRTTEHGREHDK